MTPPERDTLQPERSQCAIDIARSYLAAKMPHKAAAQLARFTFHHMVLSSDGAGSVYRIVEALAETAALLPEDRDLAGWLTFVTRNAHRIGRGGTEALVQAALEAPPDTAPARAVVRWIAWSKYDGPRLRRLGPASELSACVLVLDGHDDVVFDVVWHPDGRRALTAGSDGKVNVWDADLGQVLLTINVMNRAPGATHAGAKSLAIHPRGHHVAVGGLAGEVSVWDVESGALVWRAEAHGGAVEALRFTADGERLLSGGGVSKRCDDAIIVWSAASGERLATVRGGGRGCRAIELQGDGRSFVTVGPRPEVSRWFFNDLDAPSAVAGLSPGVARLARSADGRTMLAVSTKSMSVLDASTLSVVAAHDITSSFSPVIALVPGGSRALVALGSDVGVFDLAKREWETPLRGSGGRITALAAHPDGVSVLCASEEGTVRRLSLATPRSTTERAHRAEVTGIAIDGPRHRAISIGNDGVIQAWSLDDGALVKRLRERSPAEVTCAIDAESDTLATSDEAGVISMWDLASDSLRTRFESRTYGMNLLALSPGGSFVAMAGGYLVDDVSGSEAQATWAIRFRDTEHGALTWVLSDHEGEVTAMAFLPDGGFVSLDDAGAVRVWDVRREVCLHTFEVSPECLAMALIPGTREILVAGPRIQRWSIDTGELRSEFVLTPHRARTITVSPDGRSVLTLGVDRALCVWSLDSGDLLARWESDLAVRTCALAEDRIVLGDDAGAITFLSSGTPTAAQANRRA